jgi:hypothetical protein
MAVSTHVAKFCAYLGVGPYTGCELAAKPGHSRDSGSPRRLIAAQSIIVRLQFIERRLTGIGNQRSIAHRPEKSPELIQFWSEIDPDGSITKCAEETKSS